MRLTRYKYYIVDITDTNNVFAYRKGFLSAVLAIEAKDAYLSPEKILILLTGSEIEFQKIPLRKSPFSIHKPYVIRRAKLKARTNNATKRARLSGKGIVTHLFKRVWGPLPIEPKVRTAALLKDRDKIRNKILK